MMTKKIYWTLIIVSSFISLSVMAQNVSVKNETAIKDATNIDVKKSNPHPEVKPTDYRGKDVDKDVLASWNDLKDAIFDDTTRFYTKSGPWAQPTLTPMTPDECEQFLHELENRGAKIQIRNWVFGVFTFTSHRANLNRVSDLDKLCKKERVVVEKNPDTRDVKTIPSHNRNHIDQNQSEGRTTK